MTLVPSTLNLILQFAIIGVLSYGILVVKKGRHNSHGIIVFTAVVLNTLSVAAVMLPSAYRIMSGATQSVFTLVVSLHSVLGFVVWALGVYIVLRWRFQPPGPTCWRMKGLMRVLAALWMVSVLLGAVVYYLLL